MFAEFPGILGASQTAQYSVEIWFQVAGLNTPENCGEWSKTSTFGQEISLACLEHLSLLKLAQTPVVGLVYTKRSVFVFNYGTALNQPMPNPNYTVKVHSIWHGL
jgi:hypothetical protein